MYGLELAMPIAELQPFFEEETVGVTLRQSHRDPERDQPPSEHPRETSDVVESASETRGWDHL